MSRPVDIPTRSTSMRSGAQPHTGYGTHNQHQHNYYNNHPIAHTMPAGGLHLGAPDQPTFYHQPYDFHNHFHHNHHHNDHAHLQPVPQPFAQEDGAPSPLTSLGAHCVGNLANFHHPQFEFKDALCDEEDETDFADNFAGVSAVTEPDDEVDMAEGGCTPDDEETTARFLDDRDEDEEFEPPHLIEDRKRSEKLCRSFTTRRVPSKCREFLLL